MSVDLPDLSSPISESKSECECNTKTLEDEIKELKHIIEQRDNTIKYLEKALDVSLKHEPVFVYEHCGHCPRKPE